MSTVQKIFKYQIWHLFSLVILIMSLKLYVSNRPEVLEGTFRLSTRAWFWLAIAIPVIHQAYAWLVWRLELYQKLFTKRYGTITAFKFYAIGFSLLFISRLGSITILAYSNKGTLNIDPMLSYILVLIITPPIIYLFYSVLKYFTIKRAYGIDHFVKNYNEPYVKKGIFKYTNNGMYIFGLMILYLPGLLFLSEAAILVALFNHLYIWAHYFFTEKPDMIAIYGNAP